MALNHQIEVRNLGGEQTSERMIEGMKKRIKRIFVQLVPGSAMNSLTLESGDGSNNIIGFAFEGGVLRVWNDTVGEVAEPGSSTYIFPETKVAHLQIDDYYTEKN